MWDKLSTAAAEASSYGIRMHMNLGWDLNEVGWLQYSNWICSMLTCINNYKFDLYAFLCMSV